MNQKPSSIHFQGPVRFYNNERRANILLKQFQSDKEIKIGEFNSIEEKLMFESGEPLKWVMLFHVFILNEHSLF